MGSVLFTTPDVHFFGAGSTWAAAAQFHPSRCYIIVSEPSLLLVPVSAGHGLKTMRGGPGKRSQRGCYDVVGFGGGVANQQTVKKKRRIHSAEFKARVALEALKGIKTI